MTVAVHFLLSLVCMMLFYPIGWVGCGCLLVARSVVWNDKDCIDTPKVSATFFLMVGRAGLPKILRGSILP